MEATETVRFPKTLAKRLRERASKTGFKRSDIIRAAVAALLATPVEQTAAAIVKCRMEGAK
jgi:Arc/MetJ-type ribon-helix-helix transcriptional regulator